jgi:hypothetical protein
MKFAFLAFVVSAILVAGAQSPQADFVLDIVAQRVAPESSAKADATGISAGAGGAASGVPNSSANVQLTLESLEPISLDTGDSFVYDVLIQNVGPGSVVLPWSPDPAPFKSPASVMPPALEGSLFLEVRDRNGSKRLAWLEPQLLFGSKEVAGSLQTLARGERALIRVPGHWRTSDRETNAILREPNGVVQVSAVLHVVQAQLLVRSVNGLEASVRDRLRR